MMLCYTRFLPPSRQHGESLLRIHSYSSNGWYSHYYQCIATAGPARLQMR
jgi:hypothetical protein